MEAAPFALTKIQPPRRRPQLIERPALAARLDAALGSARLLLISAPAGSGKTVALTQLLARHAGEALAWIALDEDDDLGRVAACLVAALEPADLPWRSSPEALVLAAQDGTRASRLAFVAALANALAASDTPRGLLVFDDAHRVADPAVFELLDALVEHLPPHWTLMVATRTDPPLALARLRARGELAEFKRAQLDFSADEVAALARLRHPGCSEAEARALHERTHGWAAGLGLALSDNAASPATAPLGLHERHAFDYLASEVLDAMPAPLRDFLLRSSVLAELTPERCAAVSGDAQAARWLEEVEQRGLFVSVLDGETRTVKLHDLFRDCLDDRLRRERPDELPVLLRRAAAAEPDPTRRLAYLLRAGAWDEAEALLVALAPQLLTQGAIAALQRLIAQFPAEQAERSAPVQMAMTLTAWAQWNWPAMRRAATRAAELFGAQGDAPQRQRALSYLCIAYSGGDEDERAAQLLDKLLVEPLDHDTLCRALLVSGWVAIAMGDRPQLASLWSQIVGALEQTEQLQFWYECTPLPSYVGAPGMRAPLLRYAQGAWRHLPEQPIPLSGMLQVMQGWLQLWAGDHAAASRSRAQAEADSRWLGRPTNLELQSLMLGAMLAALTGDSGRTRRCIDDLLVLVEGLPDAGQRAAYLARMVFWGVRMAAIAGDRGLLVELAGRLDAHADDPQWHLPDAYRAACRAYVADTEAAWQAVVQVEALVDVFGQGAEARLRLADRRAAAGDLAGAATLLGPVLVQSEASGEAGPLLCAGPAVLARLAARRWN
ncbi:MAG TPA: AAA family ATPase, partial [Methylibium sp.]|nr:AAA family ATPase [Methylibium sp.]